MFGSFELARISGIPVRIHTLLLVLLGVVVLRAGQPLVMLVSLALLIVIVGLHELGHCLVARRYGARVLDITLWPLGGMARMSDLPEDSRAEAAIALAGPAVNFALAAASLLVVWPLAAASGLEILPMVGQVLAGTPLPAGASGSILALLVFLGINLVLGLFNLLPAFPMDGGRVLRAWLGRNGDWVSATERAVRVSRWLAVLMFALGLASSNLVLALIPVFVWMAGARELWSVRLRHGRFPFGKASQGRGREASGDLSDWLAGAFASTSSAARANGEPWSGEAGREPQPGAPARARNPSGWPPARLTDEAIADLERFRGPLPRWKKDAP